MASTTLYKAIAKADQDNTGGGYKNVFLFAPRSTFLSIKTPSATPTVLGDKVKIVGSHTFNTDEGWISWLCKKNSVTITAETTGEAGARDITWKAKFVLLGDSATTQEQLQDLLNDDIIALAKDQDCLNATDYVQLGDECVNPDITVTFDGKTTADGLKEYTVDLSVKGKKFWYSGTVTMKP